MQVYSSFKLARFFVPLLGVEVCWWQCFVYSSNVLGFFLRNPKILLIYSCFQQLVSAFQEINLKVFC